MDSHVQSSCLSISKAFDFKDVSNAFSLYEMKYSMAGSAAIQHVLHAVQMGLSPGFGDRLAPLAPADVLDDHRCAGALPGYGRRCGLPPILLPHLFSADRGIWRFAWLHRRGI